MMGSTVPHAEPPQPLTLDELREADHEHLPIDRNIGFYPELYPADPDAYEPLDHFYQRQKEDQRLLERPIEQCSAVRKTIATGDLRDNGDGCGVFVLPWDGITFYIVVGRHVKGYPVAVSGWPVLQSEYRADKSATWSSDEIEMVESFNDEYFDQKNQFNRFKL